MELNERCLRKKNIIIFGLPEQNRSEAAKMRLQKDKRDLSEVLRKFDANVYTNNIKPNRLGRVSNNKTQPIEVTLQGESSRLGMLKNPTKMFL